jgi:hypothetical protein
MVFTGAREHMKLDPPWIRIPQSTRESGIVRDKLITDLRTHFRADPDTYFLAVIYKSNPSYHVVAVIAGNASRLAGVTSVPLGKSQNR